MLHDTNVHTLRCAPERLMLQWWAPAAGILLPRHHRDWVDLGYWIDWLNFWCVASPQSLYTTCALLYQFSRALKQDKCDNGKIIGTDQQHDIFHRC